MHHATSSYTFNHFCGVNFSSSFINPNPPSSFSTPHFHSHQKQNTQTKTLFSSSSSPSDSTPSTIDSGKAMGLLKAIFIIATTMALSITLTMKTITKEESNPVFLHHDFPSSSSSSTTPQNTILLPSKRVNRFLAQVKNPNAADHCHKDHDVCSLEGVKNSTCCNNKCIDVGYDKHNCGACKKKCKYTETCCRGECVDTNLDKRHCGECNNRCELGEYCVYGMCGYA
ncbi:Stigma-specific protein Stig1 [Vigna unguiculata]|uniref:Stigma-specific protein Stig1 n=2 Tax=Vigna unguiculata TaxID=3917 RepID=A0A4D6KT05_VIGUN|nr:Stigma-specific protein Stig1 [Vigna unguiculata]